MNFSSNYCNYKASIIGYEGLNFSVRNRKRNAKFKYLFISAKYPFQFAFYNCSAQPNPF